MGADRSQRLSQRAPVRHMSEQNAIVFFCVLQCLLHVILIARLMLGQDNGKSEVLPNAKARSMPHRRMQAI